MGATAKAKAQVDAAETAKEKDLIEAKNFYTERLNAVKAKHGDTPDQKAGQKAALKGEKEKVAIKKKIMEEIPGDPNKKEAKKEAKQAGKKEEKKEAKQEAKKEAKQAGKKEAKKSGYYGPHPKENCYEVCYEHGGSKGGKGGKGGKGYYGFDDDYSMYDDYDYKYGDRKLNEDGDRELAGHKYGDDYFYGMITTVEKVERE